MSLAVVEKIKSLYEIEKEAQKNGLPPDKIKDLRQEKAKPLLAELKKFLEKYAPQVPPKSGLGKAIGYALRQWHSLLIM